MSYTREINTIELWLVAAEYLSENGYKLWQTQYDVQSPEEFHARFWETGKPEL